MKISYSWALTAALSLLTSSVAQAQGKAPDPSPYDSAHFSWRKPVPGNRLRPLRPDRPGVTESPFTVDAGHFQLEMDGLRLINQPGGGGQPDERSWHVGFTTLKLGLGRRTDVQLEVPAFATHTQRLPGKEYQDRTRGVGNLTIRLK